MQHIAERGTVNSLHGPVERADVKNVEKQFETVWMRNSKCFIVFLSEVLISIGEKKNPGRDYRKAKTHSRK